MYSNEGAVDPTAVKMSQMVGVFLAGLGLAAVTMRPAELDESDLLAIRDDIGASISGLQSSLTAVTTSVERTNEEVRLLKGTLEGMDVDAIMNAADAVVSASQGLQSGVSEIRSALENLDLSVDVEFTPVIEKILSTHGAEMQKMLDIMNHLDTIDANNVQGWTAVKADLLAALSAERASLTGQIEDLMGELQSLDVDVDLTPVLDAAAAIKVVTEEHSMNFDLFVQAIAG